MNLAGIHPRLAHPSTPVEARNHPANFGTSHELPIFASSSMQIAHRNRRRAFQLLNSQTTGSFVGAVADCWYPCRSATGSESAWKASLIRSRRELVVSFPQRGAASRLYLRCFGGTQAGSMYYGLLGRLTV